MDRPCPSAIVLIARFEHGQVEMMFDQFIQCVFKGTRLELRLERKRNKNHLIVLVWFVSGHVFLQTSLRSSIVPLFRQSQRCALPAGGRDEETPFWRNQLEATQTA